MRLYKRHDSDLLCLYKQHDFSFQKAVKAAVLSYLDNSEKRIDYPDCLTELSALPSTAQFHLYLSKQNEDDAKIIACMSKIPKGFKNSFLKNVTRYYLSAPTTFAFKGGQIQILKERNSFFSESQVKQNAKNQKV